MYRTLRDVVSLFLYHYESSGVSFCTSGQLLLALLASYLSASAEYQNWVCFSHASCSHAREYAV